jgi:DNA repair protein RadC
MTAAMRNVAVLDSPKHALAYARIFRGAAETMTAIWTDGDAHVIGTTLLPPPEGDIDSTVQLMVDAGKKVAAVRAFLVHNDPTNRLDLDEGSDYREFTQQVSDGLDAAGIQFVDHLIVTPKQLVSLRQVIDAERDDSTDGDPLAALLSQMNEAA